MGEGTRRQRQGCRQRANLSLFQPRCPRQRHLICSLHSTYSSAYDPIGFRLRRASFEPLRARLCGTDVAGGDDDVVKPDARDGVGNFVLTGSVFGDIKEQPEEVDGQRFTVALAEAFKGLTVPFGKRKAHPCPTGAFDAFDEMSNQLAIQPQR